MMNNKLEIIQEDTKKGRPCGHTHVLLLMNKKNMKDFWQKMWLIDRYIKELGFDKEGGRTS